MEYILHSASAAIRQAQLHATTALEQDSLGAALDLVEGELPNILDLLHELVAAYSKQSKDPKRDPLLARAQQVIERVEGLSLNHVLAQQHAVDEIEE